MTVQTCTAPVHIPQKIFLEGKKQYLHIVDGFRQVFETKKAYRRALSQESGGAWIEVKGGKKRYFVDQSSLLQTSFKQVSMQEFHEKLNAPSNWQKVLSLGLLALQQKNLAFAFLGYSCISGGVDAQAVGTEFQVNTNTTGSQYYPSGSSLNNGDFVIAWQSPGQDGDSWGIYAQRYNIYGIRIGDEFRANTNITGGQTSSTIAPLNDGGFIIAWASNGQDGDNNGIFGQRYAQNGQPSGMEFQVNNYTVGSQTAPRVATLIDGKSVFTWFSSGQDGSGTGVYAQMYDSIGNPFGSEFRVNTNVNGAQQDQSIASLDDGGFAVVWTSNGQDGSGDSIYGQKFDGNGTKVGSEFRANSYTSLGQYFPSIAKVGGGGFVLTWISYNQDRSDGGNGIYAQRFNENATRSGSEFLVNTYTTGSQVYPEAASLTDGNFVIVWESQRQDNSSGTVGAGVYGQRFNSTGFRNGTEFQVNNYTAMDQRYPFVTSINDGGFVVVWQSEDQDGDGYGIFGQRYDASGNPIEIELPIPTSPTPTSVSSIITSQVPNSMSTGTVPFVEFVYSQPYTISQNGQTIGTFSFSGGTGQFSNANPNTINLEIDPNYTIQDGDTFTLFTIPEGESFVWEGLTIDSECFDAEGEIIQNQSGENSFQVIFNPKPDTCTFYSGASKLKTLPLLATGGLV